MRRGLQPQRLPVLQPGDLGGGLPLCPALQSHSSALQHAVLTGDPRAGDPGCHCAKKSGRLRKRRGRKAPLRGRARRDPCHLEEALPRTSTMKSLRISVPAPRARQVYRPWWKGWRGLRSSWSPPATRPHSGLLSVRRRGEGGCSSAPLPSPPQACGHAPPLPTPRTQVWGHIVKAEVRALQSRVFALCCWSFLGEKSHWFGGEPLSQQVPHRVVPRELTPTSLYHIPCPHPIASASGTYPRRLKNTQGKCQPLRALPSPL